MPKLYTVQLTNYIPQTATIEVEADSVHEACRLALENEESGIWEACDDASAPCVDAIVEGPEPTDSSMTLHPDALQIPYEFQDPYHRPAKLTVYVEGGVVQDVICEGGAAIVTTHDRDNEADEKEHGDVYEPGVIEVSA